MRVLFVNTSERVGGAAIAARRLAHALTRQGVAARMLVGRTPVVDDTTTVAGPAWRRRWAFLYERLTIFLANRLSLNGLWAVDVANAGVDIVRTEAFRQADIVHLHWVNQGFLSMSTLQAILHSGKPVVWTLHDMWPVTAICHHAGHCDRYHTHCHHCPQLRKPSAHDLSQQLFARKLDAYAQAPLTFVGVSTWMAERARQSALAQGHDVLVIPNTLSAADFRPVSRSEARTALGIPSSARVVAFGAARIDLPSKGLTRLFEALGRLQTAEPSWPLHLLLFGGCKDRRILDAAPCPYTYIGPVEGGAALSQAYSAADVLASASEYESFGQTLAEAMACGCVPVSFDRGGQADIIRHLSDGYLARYGDCADLSNGLRWALTSPPSSSALRQSALSRFGEDIVARQYIDLYTRLI